MAYRQIQYTHPKVTMLTKKCPRCQEVLSVDRFSICNRWSTGRQTYCKLCSSKWRAANRDYLSQSKKDYYYKNRERCLAVNLAAQKRNKTGSNERSRRWRENNKEKRKAVCLAWVKRNQPYANAIAAKRRSAKMKATPAWANLKKIEVIYKEASEKKLWVDHIVPLRSNRVCGFHCEDNLQLLSREENIRKSNKIWPDM